MLGCLWNRSRLQRFVGGESTPRATRAVSLHLERCTSCRAEVQGFRRQRALIQGARIHGAEPDWTGFWPGIRARIAGGTPKPMRAAWWLPLWMPIWGHPRVALGGILASTLAAALLLWPSAQVTVPVVMAAPVQVQDVSAADPHRSVMVYSSPEEDVTVIWVFNPEEQDGQS